MNSAKALSSIECVQSVANRFFAIADAVHKHLNANSSQNASRATDAVDQFGLLIEEYGLRTRAGILRNSASQYVVTGARTEQEELERCLDLIAQKIGNVPDLVDLRSILASVSTLCVGISPGKSHVIDFLVADLTRDAQTLP